MIKSGSAFEDRQPACRRKVTSYNLSWPIDALPELFLGKIALYEAALECSLKLHTLSQAWELRCINVWPSASGSALEAVVWTTTPIKHDHSEIGLSSEPEPQNG